MTKLLFICAILLVSPNISRADSLNTSVSVKGQTQLAWNQPTEKCYKCVVRTYNAAYQFFVLSTDPSTAEDIAKNAAKNKDPYGTLIGSICSEAPGQCK